MISKPYFFFFIYPLVLSSSIDSKERRQNRSAKKYCQFISMPAKRVDLQRIVVECSPIDADDR